MPCTVAHMTARRAAAAGHHLERAEKLFVPGMQLGVPCHACGTANDLILVKRPASAGSRRGPARRLPARRLRPAGNRRGRQRRRASGWRRLHALGGGLALHVSRGHHAAGSRFWQRLRREQLLAVASLALVRRVRGRRGRCRLDRPISLLALVPGASGTHLAALCPRRPLAALFAGRVSMVLVAAAPGAGSVVESVMSSQCMLSPTYLKHASQHVRGWHLAAMRIGQCGALEKF